MSRIKEELIAILLVFINLVVTMKILIESFKIVGFDYKFVIMLFLAGVIIYGFYAKVLNKGKYKILFTFTMLLLGGGYGYRHKSITISFFENIIKTAIEINTQLLKNSKTYFPQYREIFFIVLPILVSVVIYITYKNNKAIILLNFIFVVSFWFLHYSSIIIKNLHYYLFITIMTFVIANYIKLTKKYKSMELKNNLDIKKITAYALITAYIIIKTTSLLPQHYTGMNLNNYGDFWENTFAKTSDGRESALNGKFTINSSGYSNSEKKLGGPVTLNKQEVFRVKSSKPYYLKGSVKEHYTGSSWTTVDKKLGKKDKNFKFENSYIKRRDMGVGASLGSVRITPTKKFNSTSFFTPNMGIDIKGDYDEIYYNKVPTFLSRSDVTKPYDAIYYIYKEYYGMSNYGDVVETLENMINNKENIRYAHEFNYYNFSIRNFGEERYFFDEISKLNNSEMKTAMEDYKEYMRVSNTIPSEVYDLTAEIVGDNDTVIEKASSIRNYLSENYPYTLKVSNVPMNEDFVSYFLFKEKKGYCTYFASATTIMCRIAGIPARYVEGFKTSNNIDKNGEYIVTNGEAHAWCEVLIDPNRDIWAVVDPSPTPTEFEEENTAEEKEREKETLENDNEKNKNTIPNKNKLNREEEEEYWDSELDSKYDNTFKYLSLIVTVVLYILIRIIGFYRKRNKIISSKSAIPLYQYYLRRLESIMVIKDDEIGDLEFVNSIKNLELKNRLEILVKLSYEEFYGNKAETSTIEKLEYFNFIEMYVKNNDNRINYMMKKYFGL
ncbi:hypothetical protein UT300018_26900 [Clostridium faecium]